MSRHRCPDSHGFRFRRAGDAGGGRHPRRARHPVRDDRRLGAPLARARHAPGARGARPRRQGVHRRRRRRRAPRPASSPRTRSLPVIGVPIDSSALKGLDALLSTVQMPPGVPVATVSIGKPGATNAGVLAAQILARRRSRRGARLEHYKKKLADKVEQAAEAAVGCASAANAAEPASRSEPRVRARHEIRHRHLRLPREPGGLAAASKRICAPRGGVEAASADADLVIVNTCSVTATADQGARQTIRRIARDNPAARIVVDRLLRDALRGRRRRAARRRPRRRATTRQGRSSSSDS